MMPEAKARQLIDRKLEQAGWTIQDTNQLNLSAAAILSENAAHRLDHVLHRQRWCRNTRKKSLPACCWSAFVPKVKDTCLPE